MSEQHRPTESPQESVAITDLNHVLGLQRVNLHDCIAVQREGKDASAFSPKEQIAAMEALIIEEIWSQISLWIAGHGSVFGLAETNVPELTNLNMPAFERVVPPSPMIKPITADHLASLRNSIASCNERSVACTMIEPLTRNVLQYHLVQWEAQQKLHAEFGWAEEKKSDYYEQYTALLRQHVFSIAESSFPATRKMVHGFTFGQHVLWHLPERTADEVINKIAMSHLHVLRHINPTVFTPEELFSFDASGAPCAISQARLSAAQADIQRTGARRFEFMISPSDSNITTGCPAYFTEAFQGVHEWIKTLKRELIDGASQAAQ